MPMMQTARGIVFIEGSSESAPAGVLVEPAELRGDITTSAPGGDDYEAALGGPSKSKGKDGKTAQVQGSPKAARPVKQSPSAAAAAKELEQFSTWLAKGKDPDEFVFNVLDDVAASLLKAQVSRGPKVPSSSRPPLYSRGS
jgi:hypothetical protein